MPFAPTAQFETISPAAGGIGNALTSSIEACAFTSKTKQDRETTATQTLLNPRHMESSFA